MLAEQGEIEAAKEEFQKVIDASPNLPNGYGDLGELLTKKHDYLGAIANLKKALSLQPDGEEYHIAIAIALRQVNRLDDALRHELIALQAQPAIG